MNQKDIYQNQHCVCLEGWMAGVEARQYLVQAEGFGWRTDTATSQNFQFDVCDDASLTQALNARVFELAPVACALVGRTPEYFEGTVKRLKSGPKYRFPWHSDKSGGRILGVSLCLAEAEGGAFEIRKKWMKHPHAILAGLKPGDVHLFDVSDPTLVHRVAPITGSRPRVFFAGWFYA